MCLPIRSRIAYLIAIWLPTFGIPPSVHAQPGSIDPSFAPGPPFVSVSRLAVQGDGKLFVIGNFTNYLGAAANGLLRLEADGTPDGTFDLGTGFEGQRIVVPGVFTNVSPPQFHGVIPTSQGVLVGGVFQAFNGQARTNLVRLRADGALDAAFSPRLDNNVLAIAVQPDGKILVGGTFKNVDGTPRNSLARLNIDGSLDTTFNPVWGDIVSPGIRVIRVLTDGKILVGGTLTTLTGFTPTPKALARLDADGKLDATFHLPALQFLTESVGSLMVQADGKIVVAGPFASIGGVARKNLARLAADGTVDDTWTGVGAGPLGSETVETVVSAGNGQFYVGGKFKVLHGEGPGGIARFNADGTRDKTFTQPAGSTTYQALALAVQPDGKLLAAGIFTLGNTTDSTKSVLRLIAEGTTVVPPPQITGQPASEAFPLDATGKLLTVTASGSPPLAYQWYKDGVALPTKTESTLAFSQFRETDAGDYRVVVTNPGGSVTSVVASVTAILPVVITTQPQDLKVGLGQSARFSVDASGTQPITYQWRKNGVDIPGANGASLLVSSLQTSDAARYSVVVANPLGSVASLEALLEVSVDPPAIVRQPLSQQVTLATPQLTAEALAGRRLRLTIRGALAPWITQGAYDITFTPNAYSSPANGALAYASTGTYSVGLGTAPVAWLVDFAGFFSDGQSARLTLVPNGVYEFNRDGLVADQNGHWELVPAFVPPAGPSVTFSVEATGVGPLSYVWRKNGAAIPGQTGSSLTLANVQRSDLGTYTVDVSNSGGTTFSAAATLNEATQAAPVSLGAPTFANGQLRFGLPTVAGAIYDVQWSANLGSAGWATVQTTTGDGSVQPVSVQISGATGFVRVAQRP